MPSIDIDWNGWARFDGKPYSLVAVPLWITGGASGGLLPDEVRFGNGTFEVKPPRDEEVKLAGNEGSTVFTIPHGIPGHIIGTGQITHFAAFKADPTTGALTPQPALEVPLDFTFTITGMSLLSSTLSGSVSWTVFSTPLIPFDMAMGGIDVENGVIEFNSHVPAALTPPKTDVPTGMCHVQVYAYA